MAQAQLPILIEKSDGKKIEMRSNFGRNKAWVLVKGKNNFFVNIYDNSTINGKRSTARIGLGLDELDELIALRPTLEMGMERINEVNQTSFFLNRKYYIRHLKWKTGIKFDHIQLWENPYPLKYIAQISYSIKEP